MKIFNIFKRKKIEKIQELEKELDNVKNILENTSALNDSLMAFTSSGGVEWWNLSQNYYDRHYTIYRGIDLLANLGSSLPVQIFRGDKLLEPDIPLQPKSFNIYQPNPNMSLNEVIYTALVYFFYRGEFMIEIAENPFLHLIPVNPQYMTRTNNKLAWKYQHNTDKRIIPNERLIYVKLLNPDNDDRGLGPIDVIKQDLKNEESAIDYNTNYFKNHGQIAGFFYDKEGKARVKDMQDIVTQFDAVHKGAKRAYKTLGLPGGIRYEDFKQTMAEMQFLESRKDARDRFLAVLGIHKSLFGVTDQVNRSVSEEATRMLWKHNMKPKMIRIQEKFNQTLFRNYFPLYKWNYDFSKIDELKDSVENIKVFVDIYRTLGYTTNEINNKLELGMEEIKDPIGDMRFVPNNMIPIDSILEYEEQPKSKQSMLNVEDKEKVLLDYIPNKKLESSNTAKKYKFVNEQKKLLRKSSRNITRGVSKFFSKELKQILKIVLTEKFDDNVYDINVILAKIMNQLNENKTELQSIMEPIYKESSLEADRLTMNVLDIDGEPVVAEEIVASLTNQITRISDHTYVLIRKQIKDAIAAGDTLEDMSKRLTNIYKFNSARSRVIARTESANIINRTTDVRYRKEGVKKKYWLSAGGSNSRKTHSHNASLGVVPYDYVYPNSQKFPNDGNGGAGENINCRCSFIGVVD